MEYAIAMALPGTLSLGTLLPKGLSRRVHVKNVGLRTASRLVIARSATADNVETLESGPKGSLQFLSNTVDTGVPQFRSREEKCWMERISGIALGEIVAPLATSSTFFWLTSAPALAEMTEADKSVEFNVAVVTWAVFAFLYFLVFPAIIYTWLRLRWYNRSAWETFFQFMMVFIYFPGLLLLAPFINFRRLPKEGTEPP